MTASAALSQKNSQQPAPRAYEPKWTTAATQHGGKIVHDIDTNSINFENDSTFVFVHRVRIVGAMKAPNGKKFNQHISFNRVDCESQRTRIMQDVMLMDLNPVMFNVASINDDFSTPAEQTVHGYMMTKFCPLAQRSSETGI